ncbi:MAG: hypothetical protein J0L57_01340 [Burkholderiales bacterium]|nr:hypothetical protein [Burkholderiales bacterium]
MKTLLKWVGLALLVLLAVAVYRLGGPLIGAKVEQQVAKVGLSPNQVAANGPLPGEVSLYAKELACQQKISTPGYFSSLNGAEIADSERSGIFPCATFLGSRDGPNQVFAWRSASDYPGIAYINSRHPGELYIMGGQVPDARDPIMAGPYLAKADAATGREIWRTYFDNANASGWFIGNTNLNILDNGKLALSWSNNALLVDGDTGLILKTTPLPSGEAPAPDSNFKHLTIAPDRTLIYKNQTRPVGCMGQGTLGIIKCIQEGMQMPKSVLVAVHPDTLEVLDMLQLPEPAPSPHIVTMYRDRIAIYIGLNQSVRRYFWDPQAKKLSADDSWVVHPIAKGQTTATAPSVIGEWIVTQLNGAGSKEVSSSIVAIHRDDAKRHQVVFPFGPLPPGGFSFAPPKAGADPENGMVYSADMGLGKVAGIKLDQATGEMKTAFVVDNITSTFQPVIGPKDQRVLLLTNAKLNVEKEPLMAAIFTDNYKEQLTWRDAATGKILAESDFFEPLTINSLTPPGFGGRIYFPTAWGRGFYVLQAMPKPAAAR